MALTTHMIGVHAVLGAFVAGILVGESPILTKHIDEQLRGLIIAFFMPVFFGTAGLSADLTVLKDPHLLLLTLGLIAIATHRQVRRRLPRRRARRADAARGAGAGDRHERARLDRGDRRDHRPVDGRAEPGPVHDDRGDGGRSPRWRCRRRCAGRWRGCRCARRKRSGSSARRWRPRASCRNLERLLVAVDDSPNGQFGSRVAGMIAGTRSMPTTVMHITAEKKSAQEIDAERRPQDGGQEGEGRRERREGESQGGRQDREEKQADKEAAEGGQGARRGRRRAFEDARPSR